MTKLQWDVMSERLFESGVDRGAVFTPTGTSASWNGLLAVKEGSDDGDLVAAYYDGQKYQVRRQPGAFEATARCYTYPDEVEGPFNLTYRTMLGDGLQGLNRGYKIHLVYNCLAMLSAKDYTTLSTTSDPSIFDWKIYTTPVIIPGARPASHLVIDSTKAYEWVMEEFEELLYGTDSTSPYFPTVAEVLAIFENGSIVKITDLGDGTWTAEGPDSAVYMVDDTTFAIDWPSAVYIDDETYTVHSL